MRYFLPLLWLLTGACVHAEPERFSTGPVLEAFGPVADVSIDFPIPVGIAIKHSFDVHEQAGSGNLNRTLVSAARFLNMHARAGIQPVDIQVAVVVHGGAVKDVIRDAAYAAKVGGSNANIALIKQLQTHNVEVIVCGQSAAYYEIAKDDLIPGVRMALSAMTAHAVLQQQGFSLNPF